jgi:hypothetical protein
MCETSSLTLREDHRLRMLESRVLRRIFRPERVNVTRGWRKMYNEIITWKIKSRRMKWTGHVALVRKTVNGILVAKPEGKKPLGRARGW